MYTLWHNGRVYPTPFEPPTEAIGVVGGRVVEARGSQELIDRWGKPRERVDLQGRTVLPGLVDAHCHLLSYGLRRLRETDLRGVRSIAELQERLRSATTTPPDSGEHWLLGAGFDQERFAEGRWPTRADLDAVSLHRPIRVTRVCGHAIVVNSAAMRRAGMEPVGDGFFVESAMAPFHDAVPDPDDDEWRAAAIHGIRDALHAGWTGVHCLVTEAGEIRAPRALIGRSGQGPRIRIQLPYRLLEPARALGLSTGFGDDRLRIGAVKLFADGSLGARTAAPRAPYADDPGNRGVLIHAQEELDRRVAEIGEAGFQVAIHAIGDAALEAALTAIERAPHRVAPPRIEHASIAPPELRKRMRQLGVVAAVQPPFVLSDTWLEERLGPERLAWAYPFRGMRAEGITLAGSTDCPVEAVDAWPAVAAAVHRGGQNPAEALSLSEALDLFTAGSAAAAGKERPGESILPGYLLPGQPADFLVLEEDPFTLPTEALSGLRPVATVVAGEVQFKRPGASL